MTLNKLEIALLEFLIPQGSRPDILAKQLGCIEVVDRDYSGAGFFTTVKHSDKSPIVSHPYVSPFGSVLIDSPELEHGGGALVFMSLGKIDFLEAYAYGDQWPKKELKSFQLKSASNP
ncbi:MAG: hypothetical protein AAF558_06405 [Verrucomicrobiota bacterium]